MTSETRALPRGSIRRCLSTRCNLPGLFIKYDLVAHTAIATTAYLSWSSRVQISVLSSPLLPNFRTYEKRVKAIFARNGPQSLESADDDASLERTPCAVPRVCRVPSLRFRFSASKSSFWERFRTNLGNVAKKKVGIWFARHAIALNFKPDCDPYYITCLWFIRFITTCDRISELDLKMKFLIKMEIT